MPKKLNAEWHAKHPMPKRPTIDERIAWHLAHQEHCGCREIPTRVAEAMSTKPKKARAKKG